MTRAAAFHPAPVARFGIKTGGVLPPSLQTTNSTNAGGVFPVVEHEIHPTVSIKLAN